MGKITNKSQVPTGRKIGFGKESSEFGFEQSEIRILNIKVEASIGTWTFECDA